MNQAVKTDPDSLVSVCVSDNELDAWHVVSAQGATGMLRHHPKLHLTVVK